MGQGSLDVLPPTVAAALERPWAGSPFAIEVGGDGGPCGLERGDLLASWSVAGRGGALRRMREGLVASRQVPAALEPRMFEWLATTCRPPSSPHVNREVQRCTTNTSDSTTD